MKTVGCSKHRSAMILGVLMAAMGMQVVLNGCSRQPAPTPPAASGSAAVAAPWWNDAVFYEVFVRSFYDSDDDGIGDLNGLIEKLDYLNDGDPETTDDLGVTGLWLMPVMQSPSYHGYDATDYYTVEQDYGSNADFQRLMTEAHRRGIKVIVDLMLNHTSNQHPWFVEAAGDPDSPRRNWYVWSAENPGHRAPWGAPAWHVAGDSYYHGLFWEGMPDLNYRTPAVTEEMTNAARFWLEEMGADGFRLDAVRHLIEKDARYVDTQETHDWLARWDDFIDQVDPQALTVGEVWDDTAVVAPYVAGDEVDIAFEFGLAEAILRSVNTENPASLAQRLAEVSKAYPPGQYAPFLTNHDQNRTMTQLGNKVDKAQLAATILLTLPGTPFIYYGEEIGMAGQKPDELIRTPMQWSAEPGAGFSRAVPWEPVNRNFPEVNVAAQSADAASLLSRYRQLIHLRNAHPALRTGSLHALASTCSAVYAYLRTAPAGVQGESLLVVLNFSAKAQSACAFSLPAGVLPSGSYAVADLVTGQPAAQLTAGEGGSVAGYVPWETLAPRQGAILKLESSPPAE